MGNDGDLQLSNNLIRQSGSYCYESWECWVCNPAPSRAMSCEFQSISWERWGIWINQAHHVKRIKKYIASWFIILIQLSSISISIIPVSSICIPALVSPSAYCLPSLASPLSLAEGRFFHLHITW